MKLHLLRYSDDGDSTQGLLFVNGVFQCYTLEDEERSQKVKGETRIPEGTYEIKQREVLSGLTKRYRSKYPWFDYHFELQNVPDFQYVYIHIGNKDEHTDGCILVGDIAYNNKVQEGAIGTSTNAFKRLYRLMRKAYKNGEKITITIKDVEQR